MLFSCAPPPPQMSYLRDLLPELSLVAGKTDSVLISDLFYAERYDAEFETNPHIQVRYDTATKWLVLTPRADFEGYTLLAFRHGTAIYRFPVKVKRLTKHTFRYVPKGEVKQVCVMGNFNDWNRTSLPMQQEPDGSFTLTHTFDEENINTNLWSMAKKSSMKAICAKCQMVSEVTTLY